MDNELEKQFFDTFGIKQREYTQCCSMGCKKPYTDCGNCQYHEVYKVDYPQITDRILLELICICSQYGFCPTVRNIKDLKLKVLKRLFKLKKNLKNNYEHQGCHNAFVRKVRTLFEEG